MFEQVELVDVPADVIDIVFVNNQFAQLGADEFSFTSCIEASMLSASISLRGIRHSEAWFRSVTERSQTVLY